MYTGKCLSPERSGIIGKSRDYNDYCCLWLKCYYENLALPKEDVCFDENYLEHSEFHLNLIHELLKFEKLSSTKPFTDNEVKVCIQELKTGKAADEFDLSAEHLKKSD